MRCAIEPLTFALLDDIALGLQSKSITDADLPAVAAGHLGPLIEWQHGLPTAKTGPNGWLQLREFSSMLENLATKEKWFAPGAADHGFVTARAIANCHTNWTDFAMRAKRAATANGFTADEAGRLVAAVGEFHSNILEHSGRADTGYLVFDASPGSFEFVVADSGIGVLQSLRSHPHYGSLQDGGTALELALSEGVSRHYDQKDRGFGFRPLFVGLANVSRFMRFRSADHSREVSRADNGSISAVTRQNSQLRGFLCSVRCEPEVVSRKV
ncbi:MAG: ATP-binding protein [Hyphomicrobium sp.]